MSGISKVDIGGVLVDVPTPNLPDRALRDAWALGEGNVIVLDPAKLTTSLKAKAAGRRWQAETGGCSVNLGAGPMTIPTDDRAKLLLLGTSVSMADSATAPYVVNGVSITLTGAQFKTIYAAVVAHVDACFTAQTALLAAIDAGTVTTVAAIDAWAFPTA